MGRIMTRIRAAVRLAEPRAVSRTPEVPRTAALPAETGDLAAPEIWTAAMLLAAAAAAAALILIRKAVRK